MKGCTQEAAVGVKTLWAERERSRNAARTQQGRSRDAAGDAAEDAAKRCGGGSANFAERCATDSGGEG